MKNDGRWGVLRIAAQAVFEIGCIPLAVIGVPIAVLFAQWDKDPVTFTGGASDNGPPTVRGDLPWWLSWFGTFDERLPGGMYEPSVVRVYNRWGRYVCSCYWLIVRNRMFGLAKFLFGRAPGGEWWESRRLGPIYTGWGYKRYRATPQAHWVNGPFVAVASFTIRRARDGSA